MKNKDWAKFIGYQMRKQNVSVYDLADKSGLSHAAISMMLGGKTRSPHITNIENMLDALGMELCVRWKIETRKDRKVM